MELEDKEADKAVGDKTQTLQVKESTIRKQHTGPAYHASTSIWTPCKAKVTVHEMAQHLRIELFDPKWKHQQAIADARQIESSSIKHLRYAVQNLVSKTDPRTNSLIVAAIFKESLKEHSGIIQLTQNLLRMATNGKHTDALLAVCYGCGIDMRDRAAISIVLLDNVEVVDSSYNQKPFTLRGTCGINVTSNNTM